MIRTRTIAAIATALAATALLAGCGDPKDAKPSGDASMSPSPTDAMIDDAMKEDDAMMEDK